MAKKKETLTSEERLQAALVPDWEQPYKVPENWCWIKMGSISSAQYGYTAKAIKDINYPKMLRITDIQENGVDWENVPNCDIDNDSYEKYSLCDGDIVIARTGATTGKSFLLNNPSNSVFASYLIRLRINPVVSFEYVYLFLQSASYWAQISELSSGIAQPGVNVSKLQTLKIPFPPLPEQQRIVDRIESLFAKLYEAKQKAQDALDSFEPRKAAILYKAFTGELTIQWRKEHSVGMESWKNCKIGKYVNTQYGYTESASQEKIGPKFLRITDIQNGAVNWDDVPYCKITEEEFERYAILKNDIMIARTGATTGKSYLIVDDVKAVFASYLIRLTIKSPNLLPRYLYAFMQSQMYWSQITEFSAGIAQPGVNAKKLKEIDLPIPSVVEQTEIICILDDIFAKEQQAKEATEVILGQISLIKKSILDRAFRGKLGTNNSNEESALELIKQIILDTIDKEDRSKRKRKKNTEVNVVVKTIMQVLSNGEKLTPEKLKSETGLKIDDFYEQLKKFIDRGEVIETKEGGESYLEATNANRQIGN